MSQKFHALLHGPKSNTDTRILVNGRWLRFTAAKKAAAVIVANASKDARIARQARLRTILGGE